MKPVLKTGEKESPVAAGREDTSSGAESHPTAAGTAFTQARIDKMIGSGLGLSVDLRDQFAKLILQGNFPFSLSDNPAMREFVRSIVAGSSSLQLPGRWAVMTRIRELNDEYIKHFTAELATDLAAEYGIQGKVAVTMDGWTDDNMESFLVITFHWVSPKRGLQRATAACKPFKTPHTTQNLMAALLETAELYGLSVDRAKAALLKSPEPLFEPWMAALTTDTASNIRAVAVAGKVSYLRIDCVCHKLQLCLSSESAGPVEAKPAANGKRAVKERKAGLLYALVEPIRRLILSLAHSSARRDHYIAKYHQLYPGERVLHPIYPTATRWNSIFLMLVRYCHIFHVLKAMDWQFLGFASAAAAKTEFLKLDAINLILPDLLRILAPFYEATQSLSASLSVTISMVRRRLVAIRNKLSDSDDLPAAIKPLAAKLLSNLNTRFSEEFDRQLRPHVVAEFLDPRTAADLFVADAHGKASKFTNDILRDLVKTFMEDLPSAPAAADDDGIAIGLGPDPRQVILEAEVRDYFRYAREHPLSDDNDPLWDFWLKDLAVHQKWPRLRRYAFNYLACQGSEADSERVASLAGSVKTAKRRHMNGALACAAVVLGSAANADASHRRRPRTVHHNAEAAITRLQNVPAPAALAAPAVAAGAGAAGGGVAAAGAGGAPGAAIALDDDDDAAPPDPSSASMPKQKAIPVVELDEGDVDFAVVEAGVIPNEDGDLDYDEAAQLLVDEDQFEEDSAAIASSAAKQSELAQLDALKAIKHKPRQRLRDGDAIEVDAPVEDSVEEEEATEEPAVPAPASAGGVLRRSSRRKDERTAKAIDRLRQLAQDYVI